jgi:hypothetical protein
MLEVAAEDGRVVELEVGIRMAPAEAGLVVVVLLAVVVLVARPNDDTWGIQYQMQS